ncbi:hypothetical protein Tco_0448327 [Tanacetum coccineum]
MGLLRAELEKLLASQITNNSKKGLGYSAVPPPHPLILNRPTPLDLSYSGLDEFKEPEFKGYGPENSKKESNVVCENSSNETKKIMMLQSIRKNGQKDQEDEVFGSIKHPLSKDKEGLIQRKLDDLKSMMLWIDLFGIDIPFWVSSAHCAGFPDNISIPCGFGMLRQSCLLHHLHGYLHFHLTLIPEPMEGILGTADEECRWWSPRVIGKDFRWDSYAAVIPHPTAAPLDANDEDEDEEDEDKEDEEEEEEHLALVNSAVVVPTVEFVSPPEGIESVTPPPSTDITTTRARITVQLQASISLPLEVHDPICTFITTTYAITITTIIWVSTQVQTHKIASTQAFVNAVTAALPSPPLPPLPPSLYIPPPIDRKDDIPQSERPPRKRPCLFALGSRYEVGVSSTARPARGRGIDYGFVSTIDAEARRQGIREVWYGIRDTWVDPAEAVPEITPMTVGEFNTRVIELAELHEHDMHDDAQDSRTRISQRVTMDSQGVDLLMKDRIAHQETILIVEKEAYASREAWAHSVGLSQAVHYELQTHREQVHETRSQMQQTEMAELRETNRRCKGQMVEILRVMIDMRQEMGDMQAELLELREQQRRARQPGPDVRVPDHQDASRDADSHI